MQEPQSKAGEPKVTPTARLSFDEFKLYYESTEKVTDRRLETNRWNYSVCIATLLAIGAITNWGLTNPLYTWIAMTAGALFCLVAILFCALWIGQIHDFKNLNNAKFGVLSEMAPRLDFDHQNPGSVVSFCPFDREWEKLAALKATQPVGRSRLIALKSSNIEYFIPRALVSLFGAMLIIFVILIVVRWSPPPTPAGATKATSAISGQTK